MTGRPTSFTPETGDKICAEISDGKSLRAICAAEDMPCVATVFNWLRSQEGFLEQYGRAKDESADAMIEDMLAIGDDETLDPNSRRIRVDTRKWIASKLKPKRYGDKLALSGDPEGAPLAVSWTVPDGAKPA